jgi:hypothetical protein|tara:strand:+ start:368 stop:580 length:213 start_codon:yes stop_codon:yes gene_type:complete
LAYVKIKVWQKCLQSARWTREARAAALSGINGCMDIVIGRAITEHQCGRRFPFPAGLSYGYIGLLAEQGK